MLCQSGDLSALVSEVLSLVNQAHLSEPESICTLRRQKGRSIFVGLSSLCFSPTGEVYCSVCVARRTPEDQKIELGWLAKLYKRKLSGILADGAGPGTTVCRSLPSSCIWPVMRVRAGGHEGPLEQTHGGVLDERLMLGLYWNCISREKQRQLHSVSTFC